MVAGECVAVGAVVGCIVGAFVDVGACRDDVVHRMLHDALRQRVSRYAIDEHDELLALCIAPLAGAACLAQCFWPGSNTLAQATAE